MTLKLTVGSAMLAIALAGCGTSETSTPSESGNTSSAVEIRASDPIGSASATAHASKQNVGPETPDDPRVVTASSFLQAVIRGDTKQAFSQLTPDAVRQIELGGKAFAPPGLDSASFQIGQVRQSSSSQAVVQCLISDANAKDTQTTQEEMCCMLRLVDNSWKVFAIAFDAGPNRSPMILNFERPSQPQQQSIQMVEQRQPVGDSYGAKPTESPRTAAESLPAVQR